MPSRSFSILLLVAIQSALSNNVSADDLPRNAALTFSGASGGLNIPDGRVLPDGDAVFSFNNYLDPRYSSASQADNYLFGMGLLPYMEVSGRIANYTSDNGNTDLLRHLSGNIKLGLPQFFNGQPDIAFGVNDPLGATREFHSDYVVASKELGWLYGTLGAAHGTSYLNGLLAGAELKLGNTGFSVLGEYDNHVKNAGLRYASPPIASVGNLSVVASVQRPISAVSINGLPFDRTTFGVNLVVPFGANARNVKTTPSVSSDTIWTPPPEYHPPVLEQTPQVAPAVAVAPLLAPSPAPTTSMLAKSAPVAQTAPKIAQTESDLHQGSLQNLPAALTKAGLERVRVGISGSKLVIEYENHRYNQNEVDAIGIVLGLGTKMAPKTISRISAITKKAGLALYETSVDRDGYLRFLETGDKFEAREGLHVALRPAADPSIEWIDPAEAKRGYSRILVEPLINSFVATELGVFDYSLAASTQGIAPLWKGAELSVDYVHNLADSAQVKNGAFSYGSIPSGLKSATLNQSFWLTDNILNITSAGKYLYNYKGVQNETTLFVPGRDDQVRLDYTSLKSTNQQAYQTEVNIGAYYRFTYQPLDTWVELGYNKYVENDRGPSLSISRWFGDVEAQSYVRRSNQGTFVGFQLAFPLTPRQGMSPAYTHLEGPSQFSYGLETRLATQGQCNCISQGIAQEIPIAYSANEFLLNQGRMGTNYIVSQLPRMREAVLLFAMPE